MMVNDGYIMMVNDNLVGGAITILKNDGLRQWEGWHPIYEMENKPCLKPPTSIAEHVKCKDCVCFRRNMRIPAKKHHINLFHATSLVGTFPEFWVICQTSRWNRGRNVYETLPSCRHHKARSQHLGCLWDPPVTNLIFRHLRRDPAFFEFFWIYLGYAAQKYQVFTLNTFPFWPFGFGRLDDPLWPHGWFPVETCNYTNYTILKPCSCLF